jgi:2-polyprenyl-3-methyl-5-hydroxy-6-metoxy-1,4-benzoquinol methylase
MTNYAYPDGEDQLTREWFEGAGEGFKRYSEASDRRVLEKVKGWLQRRPGGGDASLLDAGCGEGRLIPELAAGFHRIEAIEPDAARLERAKARIRLAGLEDKTAFTHGTIEQLAPSARFDAVLCSHVLQHVHTASVPHLLRRLREALAGGGLLALTTCHSTTGQESFDQTLKRDGRLVVEPVSKEQFDGLIHNHEAILPCRYFTEPGLMVLLAAAGFETREVWLFHADAQSFHELGGADGIDDRINSEPALRARMGVDVLVLAETRALPP